MAFQSSSRTTTELATFRRQLVRSRWPGFRHPMTRSRSRSSATAGAVILGKSNMHELASGITTISSIGGQTCNPYDPDRAPGGSSGGSGAAVAASFAAIAWGSDTCGSIRIPSAVQNLFGLRPTKGLSSIHGIVPLSHTQDVGGPLARSVRDLAIGLDATIGPDPADTATRILDGRALPRFVDALDRRRCAGRDRRAHRAFRHRGRRQRRHASRARFAGEAQGDAAPRL